MGAQSRTQAEKCLAEQWMHRDVPHLRCLRFFLPVIYKYGAPTVLRNRRRIENVRKWMPRECGGGIGLNGWEGGGSVGQEKSDEDEDLRLFESAVVPLGLYRGRVLGSVPGEVGVSLRAGNNDAGLGWRISENGHAGKFGPADGSSPEKGTGTAKRSRIDANMTISLTDPFTPPSPSHPQKHTNT